MKAVILAGGLGTRLAPLTQIIPKPLLPIGESSILEIQILSLKKHGFKEIYIATNYKAEYIENFLGKGEKYGIKLIFSKELEPLGTCGPLTLLKDKLTEPFLVMNGDVLTTLNFKEIYQYAIKLSAILTVVTNEISTPFEFGKVISRGHHIIAIEEKPNLKFEILSGIYVMKPSILKLIPENTYFGIDKLILRMLKDKMRVGKYLMDSYWLDIGRMSDYQIAQEAYKLYFTNLKKSKK